MRLFIDESLAPRLAERLNASGEHDAIHPLHVGRRGELDHVVLARCVAEDRVIVTQNARDFRNLVGRSELHPGLIVLPAVGRERSYELLLAVLTHLAERGEASDVIVNHVAEIDPDGHYRISILAADRR